MFSIWRASTIVFVLQFALGWWVFAQTNNRTESAMVVLVVTFFVMSGLAGNLVDDDVHAVSLPACAGALTAFLGTIGYGYGFVLALIVSVLLACFVAVVGSRGRTEPVWMIPIAMLPAGIGTVLGGAILLWRRLYATANVPFPFA